MHDLAWVGFRTSLIYRFSKRPRQDSSLQSPAPQADALATERPGADSRRSAAEQRELACRRRWSAGLSHGETLGKMAAQHWLTGRPCCYFAACRA